MPRVHSMVNRPGLLVHIAIVGAFFVSVFCMMPASAWAQAGPAHTTETPQWPNLSLTPLEGNFNFPIAMDAPRDGSDRLFVVERAGRIRVRVDGVWQETPFLDISERVVSNFGECGMTGMALAPGFGVERDDFYVFYSPPKPGASAAGAIDQINTGCDVVVARFRVGDDPNLADLESEEQILFLSQPENVHQGGDLSFGPDGYLYIPLGDGRSGGDPNNVAQRLDTIFGKILRIEVGASGPYTIPTDNPFYSATDAQTGHADNSIRQEIWAYGLRNPFRIAFDRATGDLYIADVGQSRWEEVNFQSADSPGGANYGWRILEGPDCFNPSVDCAAPDNYVAPIHTYGHRPGPGCTGSVIGGYVYRGPNPVLQGIYIFGDFCTGEIRGLRRHNDAWIAHTFPNVNLRVVSFGEDEQGNLFAMAFNSGNFAVYEIRELPIAAYIPFVSQ